MRRRLVHEERTVLGIHMSDVQVWRGSNVAGPESTASQNFRCQTQWKTCTAHQANEAIPRSRTKCCLIYVRPVYGVNFFGVFTPDANGMVLSGDVIQNENLISKETT